MPENLYVNTNKRLQYWFTENSFVALYKLKQSICREVPTGKYRDAFLCLFSSILKACSKWLTKSIKPQVDPQKHEIDVLKAFSIQYQKFIRAVDQIQQQERMEHEIEIDNQNFLEIHTLPRADLIISSPPMLHHMSTPIYISYPRFGWIMLMIIVILERDQLEAHIIAMISV